MENFKEFVSFTVVWIITLCILAFAGGKFVGELAQGMQSRIASATARLR